MPVKLHPINSKLIAPLLPQLTPVQLDKEPVQAALVAVAPLQSQPDMATQVPGQLVTPCLKAHKALASDCCWLDVGATDGAKVGNKDHDGDMDGAADGTREGEREGLVEVEGDMEGLKEGFMVGAKLGGFESPSFVGDAEGAVVFAVGLKVGKNVGDSDGLIEVEGDTEGLAEGPIVGT